MSYRWLLFDADGTLFDYNKAEAVALQGAFEDLQIPFDGAYPEVYRRINKAIWLDYEAGKITAERLRVRRFALLFDHFGLSIDPADFSRRYLQRLSEASNLMDGCTDVIRRLHEKYQLAIITNGLADVQRSRFGRCAIREYISELIISEEIGAAKPDEAIFDAAFEHMGHPKREDVLMIGDSLSGDIQGGVNYRLDTCWFNPAGLPNDTQTVSRYEIRHLSELEGIL